MHVTWPPACLRRAGSQGATSMCPARLLRVILPVDVCWIRVLGTAQCFLLCVCVLMCVFVCVCSLNHKQSAFNCEIGERSEIKEIKCSKVPCRAASSSKNEKTKARTGFALGALPAMRDSGHLESPCAFEIPNKLLLPPPPPPSSYRNLFFELFFSKREGT